MSRRRARIALLAGLTALLAAPAQAAVPAGKTAVVVVVAGKPSEYDFRVSRTTVRHGTVVFKVKNLGKRAHSFEIGGKSTRRLLPHQSTTLTVVLKKPARYIFSDKCIANQNEQNVPPCAGGILKVT
jgi:uncharacterized cupredoxin-like copper-binding protein